jgi:hypothetical protein
MIIHLGKRWPQQPGCIASISVGFITGGSPHHQALVMDAAKEWERCSDPFANMIFGQNIGSFHQIIAILINELVLTNKAKV